MPKIKRNKVTIKGKKKKTKSVPTSAKPRGGLMPSVSIPTVKVGMPPKSTLTANKKSIHEAVCAISDPFCPRARNAKWPDGQGGGTMTMQVRGHSGPISVHADGSRVSFFSASLPFGQLDSASIAAPLYTMGATYGTLAGASNFATYVQNYRVVTAGIIIRNLLPALTSQGFLTISRVTKMPAVSSTVTQSSSYGSQVESHPLFAGQEIHVIFKTEGNSARLFSAQNTNNTQVTGWDIIKVEVTGAPASNTTVIDVEWCFNVEFTLPDANAALHQFVAPCVPSAPKAIEAANLVNTRVNTIVSGTIDKIGSKVLGGVETAVEDIFSWGAAFLGL